MGAIYSLMADATHGDPVMVAYLKHLLEEWMRAHPGDSEAAFSLRAGLSKSAVNNLKNLGRGAGPKTVAGFARALGTTPLSIYAGREAWARGEEPQLAPAAPEGERYPNRVEAAKIARQIGTPERAIESVGMDLLDYPGDPPVAWWLQQMQLRAALFDRPPSPPAPDPGVEALRALPSLEERLARAKADKARKARR